MKMMYVWMLVIMGNLGMFGVAQAADPQVEFTTNAGTFVMELHPSAAPKTVANFLEYVNAGFYQGTIFHRVIEKFVVQGGGVTEDLQKKSVFSPISNEADNGIKNTRGSVAMARDSDPNSATSQFFVNVADNKILNFYKPDAGHYGYCVFAHVVKGMDVVDRISHRMTHPAGKMSNVPADAVVIQNVRLLDTPVVAEAILNDDGSTAAPVPNKLIKSSKKGKKHG